MQLELTKSQLERLLELAALGEWLMNGHRPVGERTPSHDDVLERIYALADEEGLGYLVGNDAQGDLQPSEALRTRLEMGGYVADYDDCVFWDELAIRLAERDLRAEIGVHAFDALPPHERQDRVDALAEGYDREFDKRGLERLRLDPPTLKLRRASPRARDTLTERLMRLFDDKDKS